MLAALVLACEPAGPSRAPAPPTGDAGAPPVEAAPTSACVGKRASPLLFQLDATEHSSLDQVMTRDLAVVAFDCTSIAVLESCRLPGRYRFVAGRREEIVRRVSSPQEAAAPLWGASTPPLALDPGETLDLRAIAVGQRRANVAGAATDDLAGDCAGATHFVRSARVGAYRLTGRVGTTTRESAGGQLSACGGGRGSAPDPQCSVSLQVELVPIRR